MAHPLRRGVSSSQVSSWLPAAGTVSIPSRSPVGQSPIALFAAGEQGVWYDPSDLSTMFQNSAGTTPVTGVEQPVGKINDKSGRGNHATQSTNASRPTLSARYNLLTYSEQFDNAAWTKSNVTASSNTDTAPDGASTGDTLAATASNGTALSSYTAVATDYTFSVWLKRKTGTGNVDISAHSGGTWVTQTITSSWARYSVTQTMTAGAKTPGIRIATSGDEVYVWGAQLIVANDLTSNAYQRIAAATDYDSDAAKFPYYLLFDGTDDSLLTGSIDLTGTDKLTVFAGVRKLNDTNTYSVLAEFGDRGSTRAGSFTFHAPAGAGTYQFTLEGSGSKGSYDASTYTAPVTNVLSCYYNIGASTLATEIYPRVNGAIPSLSGTGGGGTGNFGNYALFIGRRNNASLPLNGRMYSLIIRAASSADSLISAVEKWIGAKSRVTL